MDWEGDHRDPEDEALLLSGQNGRRIIISSDSLPGVVEPPNPEEVRPVDAPLGPDPEDQLARIASVPGAVGQSYSVSTRCLLRSVSGVPLLSGAAAWSCRGTAVVGSKRTAGSSCSSKDRFRVIPVVRVEGLDSGTVSAAVLVPLLEGTWVTTPFVVLPVAVVEVRIVEWALANPVW